MIKDFVTVLDFGSSKITVLIGHKSVNDNVKIIATGESEFGGFSNGEFLEPNSLKSSIAKAFGELRNGENYRIKHLYVGVPAEFCFNTTSCIVRPFSTRTKIDDKIIENIISKSNIEKTEIQNTHTLIQKSVLYYEVDDRIYTEKPINVFGDKLKIYLGCMYVENHFTYLLTTILNELGIFDFDFISSSVAESLYLLNNDIRSSGAILIDCGYITSSVALVQGEGLLNLKSFSLGGGHITGDLCQVLKMSFYQAEQLKRKVILTVKPTKEDYYEINTGSKMTKIGMATVNEIVLARIDNIVENIKKCIDKFDNSTIDDTPLFITGGGISYLKGIKNYLSTCFNKKVIILSPKPLQLSKPDLSSVVSLLYTAIKLRKN